jgi:predicted porin
MLKRKALTLAVAGALGVPVAAFAQNVQIYGKLYPELVYAKTTGATASQADASSTLANKVSGDLKPRLSQDQGNSYIGFRGSEDLGGGLKAIFQIEQNAPVDEGGGIFASRDSFVGLTGGFGTVRLGNMDTVWKRLGDPMSILGVSSGNIQSSSNMIAKAGFSGSATTFNIRQANSFAYESPTFGGVQLLVQYSPDENKGSAQGATGTASTTTKNTYLASYGAKYEVGGLYLALAQEIHHDFFAGSTGTFNNAAIKSAAGTLGNDVHSKDVATRASASYEFGSTKVGGDVGQIEYKETGGVAGTFEKYKHNVWLVGVQQKFGNLTAALNYAKSAAGTCSLNGGVACTATGLDGRLIAAGLGLSYSKRTMVFALAARIDNGNSAQYDNLANGTPSPGADSTQFAVGVSHSF